MRSPADMNIIQLDITDACESRCGGCTRLVPHVSKPFYMDMRQFRKAVGSMSGWAPNGSGKILGVMGGNPVLHPEFAAISKEFVRMWGRESLSKNGRQPIKDFSAYAQVRLHDQSSGRGLWSSLGAGFYRHMEVIHDVYDYWCINDHINPGLHQTLLIDRETFNMLNKQKDDDWLKNRDNCWVQNNWSASINHNGAYFCEVAAAIDNLFYGGTSAWPVESGWWERTPKEFNDQLHLCNKCALAQPGPSVVAHDDVDVVSAKMIVPLQMLGSPAAKRILPEIGSGPQPKAAVEIYDPSASQHQAKGRDFRIDWYMPEPDMRVSQENTSIRPRSTTCIVTCVGRAQHLASTIKHNKALVDELIVVTSEEDKDTQEIASAAGVKCVQSCGAHANSAAFNKGALINDALGTIQRPDWIVLTDADVFLSKSFKEFVASNSLNPGVLYGTTRHDLDQSQIGDSCLRWVASGMPVPHGIDAEPNGYFQMFHRNASSTNWPNVMSEAFCSAGGVDSWFLQQFPADKRVLIHELAVTHISHSKELGDSWNGRRQLGQWRQTAMLCASGLVEIEPIPKKATHMKLVDTLHANVAVLDMNHELTKSLNDTVKDDGDGGFIFKGQPIGTHHIHVSYFCP